MLENQIRLIVAEMIEPVLKEAKDNLMESSKHTNEVWDIQRKVDDVHLRNIKIYREIESM